MDHRRCIVHHNGIGRVAHDALAHVVDCGDLELVRDIGGQPTDDALAVTRNC